MLKIDLNDTYEASAVSKDLMNCTFSSVLKDKSSIKLQVHITEHPDSFLPDVFNLAFGPLNYTGKIDDEIILKHIDINKVFSTVLFFAITFLEANTISRYSIGIDGSNEVRAYLYHRMFLTNNNYLSDSIAMVGVDWYVKLLRNGTEVERDTDGLPLFKPRPEPFDLNRKPNDLYRYYMFSLSN